MTTILLAWINAKYNAGYKDLFMATILLDFYGIMFTAIVFM